MQQDKNNLNTEDEHLRGFKMKGLHAVIMAGGSGTRFWPMSREMWPKQMLKIVGEESMIVQTMKRVKGSRRQENIHIVTTSSQASDIKYSCR